MTDGQDITAGLPFGECVRGQGRTVVEAEIAMLAELTWTTDEIRCAQEYTKAGKPSEGMLDGPIVASIVSSLAAHSSLGRRLREEFNVRTVAALGLEAACQSPVFPGDTLWADTEIIEARASQTHPGRGVMTVRDRGFNQRDEVVIEITRTLLFERDVDQTSRGG